MVKKIRVLTVIFDSEIKPYEIPALRGAIVEKVGKENIIFHNHLKNAFLYRYPLIQYKHISGKPALVCIEYGVDEIHKFFEKPDWSVKVGDKWLNMKIYRLLMNQFNMQVWETLFHYQVHNWVALNQDNYKRYIQIENEKEKIVLLERMLIGNIISFAKGIEWNIEKKIMLSITSPLKSATVSLKGQKVFGFNVSFKTNVFLPNYIGLGKSVSLGFGMVKQLSKR